MGVCIKLNPTLEESERKKKRRNQPSRAGHRRGGGGASATYLGIPIVVHDDKV